MSNAIQIPSMSPYNIIDELAKVYYWLAINKLYLNVKKTKYVIFHVINKQLRCGPQPSDEWHTFRKISKLQFCWPFIN